MVKKVEGPSRARRDPGRQVRLTLDCPLAGSGSSGRDTNT